MTFLLDTNVVSEWVKPYPDTGVTAWLAQADEDRVFLSVVTLAELRYGIERLPAGRRRRKLDTWLRQEVPQRFGKRVLPISGGIADAWGTIVARREAAGRPIDVIDALLAATCEIHDLTLITRNVRDFEGVSGHIINPWDDER